MSTSTYPVRLSAHLEPGLNRALWLVKWLLAIPHLVVLALLWAAFLVLSVIAFVAILVTGRYPRGIFDFNVGVLRWTWRVAYYAYGGLGTDRYPRFTLREDPSYPAHLEVDYPERLSRGLVLVKWWLLALPHYVVIGLFLGGGAWVVESVSGDTRTWQWGAGLIGLLVLVAGLVLLFTGRYPPSVFDLVMGLNRWVYRVLAYAGLMTDVYPPFRLDQGGPDPAGLPTPGPAGTSPAPAGHRAPATPSPPPSRPWSAGRVTAVVVGSVVLLTSLGLALGAAGTFVVDRVIRDDSGFVMSQEVELATTSYAVASDNLQVHIGEAGTVPERLVGDLRLTADPSEDGRDLFVGIAGSEDARAYLDGVHHATVVELPPGVRGPGWSAWQPVYRDNAGGAPAVPPAEAGIWVAQATGTGDLELTWPLRSGDWTLVLMAADGSAGVSADVAVGAELPALGWVALGLAGAAVLGLVVASLLLGLSLRDGNGGDPVPPSAQAPPAPPTVTSPPVPVPERSTL